MPEQTSSEPVIGVSELRFTILNKKNKQLGIHLHDGDTLVEKGEEPITRWLEQKLSEHVQQEFGQGVGYTILDHKGKSMVSADILVCAILKDHEKGTETVKRYGQLTAEGALQLRLKLSGEGGSDTAGEYGCTVPCRLSAMQLLALLRRLHC
jgi:hypothetical protein